MRLPVILIVFSVVCWAAILPASAQNRSEEFIESSSPLPGGGRVVSRSTPGGDVQTIASTPTVGNSILNNRSSVLERNQDAESQGDSQRLSGSRNSVYKQAASQNASATSGQRYPYPGGSGNPGAATVFPRIARGGLFYPPVRASRTCGNCTVPFQLPTLGLNNATQTQTAARQTYGNQNCCTPQYGPVTALQVPALQAPVMQLQPPANQVPALAAPQQNFGAFQGFQTQPQGFATSPVATNPTLGVPQFNNQRSSFWTPFITGSGVYQPVVRLANLRPGTYLGQGIIGQPTAYVDGQPLRNLLRYIFP